MGLGVGLIALAIILVVVFMFAGQVKELATSASSYLQAQGVNNAIGINPQVGQNVCDLKLVIQPQLVALPGVGQNIGQAIIGAVAGWSLPSSAVSTSWVNCHQYGNPFSMSWVPLSWATTSPVLSILGSAQQQNILLSAGQTVHINLVLVAPDGTQKSYLTDPLCTSLCTAVSIQAGILYVPQQYSFTFLITTIPRQTYQIQMSSELGFNGNNSGQPYIQTVS
jgi:hypothetical protein